MRKLIFVSFLALASTAALAQSSQGQTGAQASPNGNVERTQSPSGKMAPGATTGMDARNSPNGNPSSAPKATTGPSGQPSKDELPPK